jgi:formylglycine-generating enzyme required for sulfatase activity
VLDKYCVSCHNGAKPGLPDFKGGQLLTDWSSQLAGRWTGGGSFTESYFQLQRYVRRNGIEGDRRMLTPLEFHFSTTELGQTLAQGHQGVTLDHEAWDRLVTWADLNAPFYGTWGEIPQFREGQPGGKQLATVNRRADELRRKYVASGPHPDYESIPNTPAYDSRPINVPVDHGRKLPIVKVSCEDWPFDAVSAGEKQKAAAAGSEPVQVLDLGDGEQLELVRVPGGKFVTSAAANVGGELLPAMVEVPAFWMAKFETLNRQFRQFMPEHDSRTEDRHGYQFGRLGYDVNQPHQPVVRVSWDEAMAFCHWLSVKSGRQVALPTEAEWEWACRAGSDQPFWFGGLDADYSPFANLGDQTLAEFAADTALDNYSAARPMANPNRYDDWIPRDFRYRDGCLVTESAGKYKPNPWGLHDLHGNAAEWTFSQEGDRKVVRGGSWYDRPHRCTAASRQGYPPWQRVFNVGFRIVCR